MRPLARSILSLTAVAVLASCGEHPAATGPSMPSASVTPPQPPPPVERIVEVLFPTGLRTAATSQLTNVRRKMAQGDSRSAQEKMFNLVDFTLKRLKGGQLIANPAPITYSVGGVAYTQDYATANEGSLALVSGLYPIVGLTAPEIPTEALGPEGAVEVVTPSGGQVFTETKHAAVDFPADPNRPTLVAVVNKLPDVSPFRPDLTRLRGQPLFYHVATFPNTEPGSNRPLRFAVPVVVAMCQTEDAPEPHSGLQIARQGLNEDGTAIVFQLLPKVVVDYLDCEGVTASPPPGDGLSLGLQSLRHFASRLVSWAAPRSAQAIHGGLGGSTPYLSDFGAVYVGSGSTGGEQQGNAIFQASFTSDPPNAAPIGPEVGDWAFLTDGGTVLVREGGAVESKHAELDKTSAPTVAIRGFLRSNPTSGFYTASWRSAAVSNPDGIGRVLLRNASGALLASVDYTPSGNITFNNADPYNPAPVIVGTWSPGVAQRFELTLDMGAKLAHLKVGELIAAGAQRVPFFDPAARDPDSPGLFSIGFAASTPSLGKYEWDDVKVYLDPVTEVLVTPTSFELGLGEEVQIQAVPQTATGPAMGRQVAFTTSDQTDPVVSVAADGLVTALRAGVATVQATSEGKSADVSIVVHAPDLRIEAGTITPSSVEQGNSITLNGWRLKNTGDGIAQGTDDLCVSYFLSTSPTSIPEANPIHVNCGPSSLDPGESYDLIDTFQIADGRSPGEYYLLAVADYGHDVRESDEENNIGAAALTLVAPPPPVVDLTAGSGSAAIDGLFGAGEWDGAGNVSFPVQVTDGGVVTGTLYVMHDGRDLYLGLRYPRAARDVHTLFSARFDGDNDGREAAGDDIIALAASATTTGTISDFYRGTPADCAQFPGGVCVLPDDAGGGTTDGQGALQVSAGFAFIELKHPLNDTDDAHDLNVDPPQVVGMSVALTIASQLPLPNPSAGETRFPAREPYLHLTIPAAPQPDLVISRAPTITPSSIGRGRNFTVGSLDVMNIGVGSSPAEMCVGYYVSGDEFLDGSDVLIAGNCHVPQTPDCLPGGDPGSGGGSACPAPRLAPGATLTIGGMSTNIPEVTAPGPHYVLAVVDYQNRIGESDENDNTAGTSIEVLDFPDLRAFFTGATAFILTPTVQSGGIVTVGTYGIFNEGQSEPASSVRFTYYLSTDAIVTSEDYALQTDIVPASVLQPGSGGGASGVDLTLPDGIPPGTYYLGLFIDDLNAVRESNEANNIAVAPFTVAPGPDLSAVWSSPTITPNPYPGVGSIALNRLSIVNAGASAPAVATRNGVFLSNDEAITGTDMLLADLSLAAGSLGPGQEAVTSNLSLRLDQLLTPLAPGRYYLGLLVDAGDALTEPNEDNNVIGTPFEIGLGAPGTATVDGVLSAGEWNAAACREFPVRLLPSGSATGKFCVMNDAENVYVSVRYANPGETKGFFNVTWDRAGDGDLLNGGEDVWEVWYPARPFGLYTDGYLDNCGVNSCGGLDRNAGGSDNGSGAFRNDGGVTVYEMGHPLHSGDSRDMNIERGQTILFRIGVGTFDAAGSMTTTSHLRTNTDGLQIRLVTF